MRGFDCWLSRFPPFYKISCDYLKPGNKIKGAWIQRMLITFQRIPLGFSHMVPNSCQRPGCGSLWFLCWALKLRGINGSWLNCKCQEVQGATRNAGHLKPGVSRGTGHWPPLLESSEPGTWWQGIFLPPLKCTTFRLVMMLVYVKMTDMLTRQFSFAFQTCPLLFHGLAYQINHWKETCVPHSH